MSEILNLPYQHEGAEWLATHKKAGIADEPGLGKTYQAILAADMVGATRVVVVAPAKLRANWRREFEVKGRPFSRKLRVLGYEEATDLFLHIDPKTTRMPDALILDEAHYLKDWQSQRTQAIYPKAGLIEYVWPLSGTPMPNDPSELWTHFYYLKPDLIPAGMDGPMTPSQWMDMYCYMGRSYGGRRKVLGVKDAYKLRELNRALWIRRKRRDVLPQLPEMMYGEITMEASHDVGAINRIVADLPPHVYAQLIVDPSTLPFGDEHLATLRALLAAAKAPVLADYVAEELTNDPGRKLIIFAWHTDAIKILAQKLKQFHPVMIYGATDPNKVQGYVDDFQNPDGKTRVIIGQMISGGTGQTLTAASNVIFLECSWVPVHNKQAQDRILRIGQTASSCLCRIAVLKDSIDEVVSRVLARKSKMINSVIT